MARHHRQSVFGGRVLVWTCSWCCILLLRHNAGRVVAQSSLGDDDSVTDSDDDASANSDCDISSSGMIGDALCDFDLNVAACGFDGGDCCEYRRWRADTHVEKLVFDSCFMLGA